MGGVRIWGDVVTDIPEYAAFANAEAVRRLAGAKVLGRRLFKASVPLGHKSTIALTEFLVSGTDVGVHYKRGYRRCDDEAEQIRRRAAKLYAAREGADLTNAEDAEQRLRDCRGITDLFLFRLTQWIDMWPGVVLHIQNRGKLKAPRYREFIEDATGIHDRSVKFSVNAAPLLEFVTTLDLRALPEALMTVTQYREARLREFQLEDVAVISGAHDPTSVLDNTADPYAPYWPASDFKTKFGIPPSRLRQAKKRGQLRFKLIRKLPYYSIPNARELWAPDFDEQF
jgi:hypothetical protein